MPKLDVEIITKPKTSDLILNEVGGILVQVGLCNVKQRFPSVEALGEEYLKVLG